MKKALSIFIALGLTVTLTACEKAPEGDAQSVINQAWEKLADKSSSYQTGEIEFSGKGNLEVENNKAEISGSGNVQFDSTDESNMKSAIALDLKANGELEGKKGTVDIKGQIKMLDKTLFLFVDNFNVDAGDPQTNMMVNLVGNLYKSQWIALPSDSVETPDAVSLESFNGKEVAAIAKKHHFFEAKEDLGGGKYEVTINPEKLKAYLTEIGEVNGTPMMAEDLEAIDQLFQTMQYSLQVQIDDDYDLTWVMGTLSAKDEMEGQQMTVAFEGNIDENSSNGYIDLSMAGTAPGKARVEFEIEHEEKSVSIEKPENAQNFDPGALFGGAMGGGMGEGMPEGLPEGMTPEMMGLPQ
jgi:hypothetical protein